MIGRMQQSGMMRYGEGHVPPVVNIAARAEAHGPQGSVVGPSPHGRADEDQRDDADGTRFHNPPPTSPP